MDQRSAVAGEGADVLVIGSVNEDRFTFVNDFPRPGQTITALDVRHGLGGKGANQAVAAVAAGARVRFVARVGADAAGASLIDTLRRAGVDTDAIGREPDHATGSASVAVDSTGENWVIVDPGANARLTAERVDAEFDRGDAAKLVVCQGEIPVAAIERAAHRAERSGARFVLNLAPVVEIPAGVLQLCDPLVVNEHEARTIALAHGLEGENPEDLARRLAGLARSVVITLGAAGAVGAAAGRVWPSPAYPAPSVVDTTGAGDGFVGTLCARLAEGDDLAEAMHWAAAAASLSVERPGAAGSYASADEVAERIAAGRSLA